MGLSDRKESHVLTDYEILVDFTALAMAALIANDPDAEHTFEEIASQAVDFGQTTLRELKRRRHDWKKANGGDKPFNTGSEATVQRGSTGRDHQGLRGGLEGQGGVSVEYSRRRT
jgi:hypothetical protein